MSRARYLLAGWLTAFAMVAASASHAATFVSNESEAHTLDFGVTQNIYASSFTTDASSYSFTSVTLTIESNQNSGFISVRLREDDAGQPGTLVSGMLINFTASGVSQLTAIPGGGAVALIPNTTYWIVAGELGVGDASWRATSSTVETSPAGWTIGDQSLGQFHNDPLTWFPFSLGSPNESGLFSVDAVADPVSTAQVSNLNEVSDVDLQLLGIFAYASFFTTDALGYTLGSVTLSIGSNEGTSFEVKIHADALGTPGALLEDLGGVSPGFGVSQVTASSSGLALSPNTTYWIIAGETGVVGSASWRGTDSTVETSVGNWTIGDQSFFRLAGSTDSWEPVELGTLNESAIFSVDAVADPVATSNVSNLDEVNDITFPVTGNSVSSSFTTDALDYVLGSVALRIDSFANSGSFAVKIRADAAGMPGAELEDLGTVIIPDSGVIELTAFSSGLALSPNTTYWISAGETGSGSAVWSATTSTAETSLGNWTIGDQSFISAGGGTNWIPVPFVGPTNSGLFRIEVIDAPAAIPALGGLARVILVGLLIGFSAWRSPHGFRRLRLLD